MPGFFANADLSPNLIELARVQRASAGGYLDLTSSNPTQQGLLFPAHILRAGTDDYWAHRRYEPDPRGAIGARRSIEHYYRTRTPPLALDLDHIFLTASTSEAYSLLFALLCDPGDNVLAPTVSYPLFEYLAALHQVELRSYALDEERNWQIDEETLRAAVDGRTRAILLVSPHNPTGMVVGQPVPVLDELGLPVICDEVFAGFTYAAGSTPPFTTLHPKLPVFHLNGISKLFALPDLKLGWIALSPAAADEYGGRLELLNDTFLGSNSLTQALLPTLFDQGGAFVHAMHERVRNNIRWALSALDAHPALELRPPDGGYYLFPSVRGWQDEEALVLYLLEAGVYVHPGFFYGDVPGTHLMLSALTLPSVFQPGVELLSSALR